MSDEQPVNHGRFFHLSMPDSEWLQVADKHAMVDEAAAKLYALPIEEFRKIPYQPPPLATYAPVEGRDIRIAESHVTVRDGTSIEVRIYQHISNEKSNSLTPIYYNIHGGGWMTGNTESEETQNRLVAARNKVLVISVDYRRSPEFPYPCGLNDCYDVFKWLLRHAASLGGDAKRIIIGGGSAGANLATVVARRARDEGITAIIGQILNIPVTCHPDHFPASKYSIGTTSSYQQNADAPIVSATRMRLFWDNYIAAEKANDPQASPLLSDNLKYLPPALIQVAGMDPLRDEGYAYAEALKNSGVSVTLNTHAGMPHAFYVYSHFKKTKEYHEAVMEFVEGITTSK
ncbi:unnamed protein product [Clonostachys byssicola]|uniref:Alpha/beta hydrolase fold-3 domain-containing protein n=1 Tax=Clonostachys byssicola TaxID=160290 RepID=A0A9N9UD50_9HYPO|nr:unnamed protein product [Clonostachys byssicola]